jgi:hypothetical protein
MGTNRADALGTETDTVQQPVNPLELCYYPERPLELRIINTTLDMVAKRLRRGVLTTVILEPGDSTRYVVDLIPIRETLPLQVIEVYVSLQGRGKITTMSLSLDTYLDHCGYLLIELTSNPWTPRVLLWLLQNIRAHMENTDL